MSEFEECSYCNKDFDSLIRICNDCEEIETKQGDDLVKEIDKLEKKLTKTRKRANELQERYNALLGRVSDADIHITQGDYLDDHTKEDITNAEDDPRCGS